MTQEPPSEWYKTVIRLGDAWEWIGQPSHRRQHPTNSRVTATPPMCCCSSASPTRSILAIACSSERCRSPCVLSSVLAIRSEEHTSELQSLMRSSYAVFCLNKKTETTTMSKNDQHNRH